MVGAEALVSILLTNISQKCKTETYCRPRGVMLQSDVNIYAHLELNVVLFFIFPFSTQESPVLGAIGQEELAKRLAELELSRELLDDLGDDQDWFDEDFGLSSRRKQQKLKEEEARLGAGFGRSSSSAGAAMGEMGPSSGGEPQVKTPPRPELPLPLPPKLPEQPAMVVPHSAVEVEKMVHAATRELWDSFDLGNKGTLTRGQLLSPQPSLEYLGKEDSTQNQESLSIRSYRKV